MVATENTFFDLVVIDPSYDTYLSLEEESCNSSLTTRTPSLVERASLELEGLRCASNIEDSEETTCRNEHLECQSAYEALFPNACLALLYQMKGNDRCVDCGQFNPEWASVTYGTLLCPHCAEKHRCMGEKASNLLSIDFDTWTHVQILSMLEGGNGQLQTFFERHSLTKATFDDCPLSSALSSSSSISSLSSSASSSCENQKNISNGERLSRDGSELVVSAVPSESSQPSTETNEDVCTVRYRTKAALFYRENLARHVSAMVKTDEMYGGRSKTRVSRRKQKKQKRQQQRVVVTNMSDRKVAVATKAQKVDAIHHGNCDTISANYDVGLAITWMVI